MKNAVYKRALSAFLAGLMLLLSPMSAMAETPVSAGAYLFPPSESALPEGFEGTYSAAPDTVPDAGGIDSVHLFPGSVILVDENGERLPSPRTFPAIVEGPLWENPGAGQTPYVFVTFSGKIAYCVDPFVYNTNSGVNYIQKTDWEKFNDTEAGIQKAEG